MNFYAAIKSAFSQYATFSGRASRSEFWFFYLFLVIASFIAASIDALVLNNQNSYLTLILFLATLIPLIAITTRRLHDTDRSGWWQLLPFIPLVGAIILLIWLCTAGAPGNNRFGGNPLSGRG
jgi:uncharacterized membrane protein YhaH (DUF805 family)